MLTTPKSRIEQYLADIVGQEGITIPDEPKSRVEAYLDYIIQNGVKGEVSFKGVVATVDDLPTASTSIEGNVYKVTEDGNIYFCDGTQWVNLSSGGADGAVIFLGTVESTDDLPTAATTIKGNIYEVTADNNLYFCDGTQWVNLTSGGSSSSSDIDYIYGGYEGVDLTQKFAAEIANYTDEWAWIKARITAGNFEGIHIHDYISVTCSNGVVFAAQVAGINTYKGSGYIATSVGNHIDFISKELWPTTCTWNDVQTNNGINSETFDDFTESAKVFQLKPIYNNVYPTLTTTIIVNQQQVSVGDRYDKTTGILTLKDNDPVPTSKVQVNYTYTYSNDPDTVMASVPFVASNLHAFLNSIKQGVHASAATNVILKSVDYTNGGVFHYLPSKLTAVISDKYMYRGPRALQGAPANSSNSSFDNANSQIWVNMGKLWIPTEHEIVARSDSYTTYSGVYNSGNGDVYSVQYPIFKNGGRSKFQAGSTTLRRDWWTSSVPYNAVGCCYITSGGFPTNYANKVTNYRYAPVCFRIMGDTV